MTADIKRGLFIKKAEKLRRKMLQHPEMKKKIREAKYKVVDKEDKEEEISENKLLK